MKTALALGLGLGLGLASGCYGPDFSQSCFSCVDSASCPVGQACVAGRCEGGGCPPAPAPTCANTLSNVGTADFSATFKIKTALPAAADVMSQRWTCDAARDWFAVLLTLRGTLVFEVARGESGSYDGLEAAGVVRDGRPHAVVAARAGGVLSVWVDGAPAGSKALPAGLRELPPLKVGSGSPCKDLAPLGADVSDVCVSR